MKKINFKQIADYFKSFAINYDSIFHDNDFFIKINSIDNAQNDDLTFFSNPKHINNLKNTSAKGCLINKKFIKYLPKNCIPIIVENPHHALACISGLFGETYSKSNGIISKSAFINTSSIISLNVQINHNSFIDHNCEIFDNVKIGSNVTIGPNVKIGKNSIIGDNVSIYNSFVEENCEIKSGARIGTDGFGFDEKSKQKIIHHGNVIIKKNTSIGCNVTIDRAVFDSTIIGEYSQIDNLVHIAHNVIIGNHAIIAAQVGIAGSTKIGNYVMIGGQAGIAGHIIIGDKVKIGAKSGVTKNIKSNKIIAGFPAKDITLWKKDIIKIRNL